jgi:hypothetical protein
MSEWRLAGWGFIAAQVPLTGFFVRYRPYRMLFPIGEKLSNVFLLKKMFQRGCYDAGAKFFVTLSVEPS